MKQKPGSEDKTNRHRFSGAFSSYAPELRRYLTFRLGNEADAQDLAQEAYIRITRVKRQDLIEKPEAYLFRIAANLANEHLLKSRSRLQTVDLDAARNASADTDDHAFEQQLENRQKIARLDEILRDLPELYRAILLLRKRDGYSHQEIAERLKISPQTVHTYLKRALSQCREKWSE